MRLIQDEVLGFLGDESEDQFNVSAIPFNQWYNRYDQNVNDIITMARDYVKNIKDVSDVNLDVRVVKIQKLKIPIFESELKKYLK